MVFKTHPSTAPETIFRFSKLKMLSNVIILRSTEPKCELVNILKHFSETSDPIDRDSFGLSIQWPSVLKRYAI